MTWSWEHAREVAPYLVEGLWITVQATLLASAIALVAGLPIAIARTSSVRTLQVAVAGVVEFVRGTPILIQLFFLFYVLPDFGVQFSPFATGVLGLGIHYTAYTSEVYRAGIQSVPRGQWDASAVLGLPLRRVWLAVITPQALVPVLPVLGNYVVMMFKESALLSAITVQELTFRARLIGGHFYRFLEPFTLMAVFYLVVSYTAVLIVRRLEHRIRRSRRVVVSTAAPE
ncbi:MAG: ectoine/hydroxyectoine ABC transporter permease subunit EhuD [Actinomycetota bacterium]